MHIQEMTIRNYRSLGDFKVGSLKNMVIFYGENNSGKSNILSFLEQLFRRKRISETVNVSDADSEIREEVGPFWKGEIDGFSDNFFQNTISPIEFRVRIRLYRPEFEKMEGLPLGFIGLLNKSTRLNDLEFIGKIERVDTSSARIILESVVLNRKSFYELGDPPVYLAGFSKDLRKNGVTDAAQLFDIFETVLGSFNDSFLRIPPERFIERETEIKRSEDISLTPRTFKNWLFRTSMNRETEEVFRRVLAVFEGQPFNHGRVTLARVGDDLIDIFVEESDSPKLPVSRKGSGLQQLLVILSYVSMSSAKFLGIEEPEINLSPRTQMQLFNNLYELVRQNGGGLQQIMLTTHSPRIAARPEGSRRGVWMENGVTKASRPTEAQITNFFSRAY